MHLLKKKTLLTMFLSLNGMADITSVEFPGNIYYTVMVIKRLESD